MSCDLFQAILVIAILSVDTKSQIPDCKDQRGVFIAEPNNTVTICGAESVPFPCEHKFGSNVHPFWIINNKTHYLSRLPQGHFYDGKELSVKNPKLKQNNTSYQCVVESPPALQNAEDTCFYKSAVGYLWITCEAPKVQCSPIYYHYELEIGTLKAIITNITKVDAVTTYIITYSDVISGDECGSANISAISCNSGICSHVFEILSHQSNCNSDINVTVLADNLVQSVPIKIDSHNTFVNVSFDMTTPSITCKFNKQPKKNKKFYVIGYGPLTDDCKVLPHDMEGYLSNSNSVTLQLHEDATSEICFVIKVHSGSETVIVEGIHWPRTKSHSDGVPDVTTYIIAAVVVFVCGIVIVISATIILGVYKQLRSSPFREDSEAPRTTGQGENILQEIDDSTTFSKVHTVTEDKDILMKKFASKHYQYYDPQDGFGYFHVTGKQLNEIQLHKKVILMDELNNETPKFSASNFKYNSATQRCSDSEHGWKDVYAQDRGINRMLKPGTKFLFCARSKKITNTTYSIKEEVTEQCNVFELAEKMMPGFQEIWIRYLYFQFTDREYVRPDQRIIVRKKGGELVTGPGVRHILGATGDCSSPIDPPDLTEHKEWERVFIQTTTTNRQLKPGTELFFCALMEKIPKHVHRHVYDVPGPNECNMAVFGLQKVPGFIPENGYGYYKFKEEEYLKLHKNVVLMHKDGSLYSGPGAKFFCTKGYSFDDISEKKIPPPHLHDTEWTDVFIQSHSKRRTLLPGTKFLYLEYQTPYMKDDGDDDNFRQTWSSS